MAKPPEVPTIIGDASGGYDFSKLDTEQLAEWAGLLKEGRMQMTLEDVAFDPRDPRIQELFRRMEREFLSAIEAEIKKRSQ